MRFAARVYPRVGGGTRELNRFLLYSYFEPVYPRVGGGTDPDIPASGLGTGRSIPAWAGEPFRTVSHVVP